MQTGEVPRVKEAPRQISTDSEKDGRRVREPEGSLREKETANNSPFKEEKGLAARKKEAKSRQKTPSAAEKSQASLD